MTTSRDAWSIGYSGEAVRQRVTRAVTYFNGQVAELQRSSRGPAGTLDPGVFGWLASDTARLRRGEPHRLDHDALRLCLYRPFSRQRVWFDRDLVNRAYQLPGAFPTSRHANFGLLMVAPGETAPFCVLATDLLPDLHVLTTNQFFPRWTYEDVRGDDVAQGAFDFSDAEFIDGYRRTDNIGSATAANYRRWYGADVTTDEVFAFVYGLLHSPEYRDRFAADLKRSLPRIPRIEAGDFAAFRDAGQALLDLHIGYEGAELYPLVTTGDQPTGVGSADRYEWFRVEKLRWGGKGRDADKSTIVYNPRITVTGIPDAAHRYMLGSRSALEWVIDRYRVTTDKASGITNDPNDWSREVGNPRYILDLIAKVITVSVETMRIVDALPPLHIHENQS